MQVLIFVLTVSAVVVLVATHLRVRQPARRRAGLLIALALLLGVLAMGWFGPAPDRRELVLTTRASVELHLLEGAVVAFLHAGATRLVPSLQDLCGKGAERSGRLSIDGRDPWDTTTPSARAVSAAVSSSSAADPMVSRARPTISCGAGPPRSGDTTCTAAGSGSTPQAVRQHAAMPGASGRITVDLAQPPQQRWRLDDGHRARGRQLLQLYGRDLGIGPHAAAQLAAAGRQLLRPDHLGELQGIADQLALPLAEVLVGNLYYDALKTAIGCSAFAVDAGGAVLHARNLDWWTENDLLARHTLVVDFVGAPAGSFTAIGWPGFAGLFSAVARGRFAITLNAALSTEPAQLAPPVVFELRSAFETVRTFAEVVERLAAVAIPCDCLLLVTGPQPGEMVVLERTPRQCALRRADGGVLAVTNDFLALRSGFEPPGNALLATSCGRYARLQQLLAGPRPQDAAQCLRLLSDAAVRMTITVQQMVFEAASGRHWLAPLP